MPVCKKVFCLFFLLFISRSLFAFAPFDSTGVKVVQGKKFIVHKVEMKDYWYSVARRYKVSPIALQKANAKIQGDLKVGNTILIPMTDKPFIIPPISKPEVSLTENEKPIKEVVAKKEEKIKASEPIAKPKEATTAVKANTVIAKETAMSTPAEVKKDESKKLAAPVQKEVKEAPVVKKNEVSSKQTAVKPVSEIVKGKFPIIHQVKQGETIFSISQKYSIGLSELIGWNNLVSDELKPNQQLVVGFGNNNQTNATEVKAEEAPKTAVQPMQKEVATVQSSETDAAKPVKNLNTTIPRAPKADINVKEVNERGIALWINDKDINPSKFYALHRTAPIGTIIKVTNTLNNKDVFVKVVGTLPDTGDNNNVIIKISKAAVDKMEAIDQKFQVSLSYGDTK